MIRRATPDDIPRITEIYNQAIFEGGYTGDISPLTIENRQNWFADHQGKYSIFVKLIEGHVEGYIALSPYRKGREAFAGTCEISYYISNSHRGQGIGKELIKYGIEYSERIEFTSIIAVILASNIRSISILLKHGFSISGRLPKVAWINEQYIDHVYLSRELPTH